MTTSAFPDEYDDFGPAPVPSVPGTPGTLLSSGHLDAHALLADAAAKMQRAIGKPGEIDPASIEKRLADVIDTSAAAAADATSAQAAAAAAELGVTSLVAALGTAAYTDATDYATAAQGTTADATASSLSALSGSIGTAAFLDTGTSAGNVVVLGVGGALPAVSGAALLDLPSGGVTDYADLTGKPALGTAAATDATDYAPAAKGVTNGDSHDHNGGDGAQIAYGSLSGTPTLGTAAAAATGDFEPAGAVSTHAGLAAPHSGHSTPASVSAAISSHNATSGVHGISGFMATVLDDADAAAAKATLVLGNVDNTSDADKPVSTAQQTALNLKANLASPRFTGSVGIGVSNPTKQLEVELPLSSYLNGVQVNHPSGGYFSLINGTGADFFVPTFYGKGTLSGSTIGLMFVGLASDDFVTGNSVIQFSARNSGGSAGIIGSQKAFSFKNYTTDLIVILGDGRVGIGTSLPSAPLHLIGSFRQGFDAANYQSATVSSGGIPTWTSTGGAFIFQGDILLDKTITAGGTTGARTINHTIGSVNFAAGASSLVVTNNRVTTSSVIQLTIASNDATLKYVSHTKAAGSFTIHANAAATAETRVDFCVFN